MSGYALFGLTDPDLEAARALVEARLGIRFALRENDAGEYYLAGPSRDEHFILQANFEPGEQDWAESEHQAYRVLLYANRTTRAAAIAAALGPEVTLLRESGRC